MINFHPTHAQLVSFVEGNCAPATALMISAHSDMCPKCSKQINLLQSSIGEQVLLSDDVDLNVNFGSMLANITSLPKAERATASIKASPKIELDGREFTLPRALGRYAQKTSGWSHLLGNIWQASVDIGPVGKADFIYMKKGGKVPEHTHRGNEFTLVIDGEFSDGIADYDTGDFILMNESNTHAPYAEVNDGCLVFSIVDAPLHFTSGIARLLNPFSHLFFKYFPHPR